MIPGHQITGVLKVLPGDRMVLRTTAEGRSAVTRVFLTPVPAALGRLVQEVVRSGRGSISGLPEAVALPLEGYRVRSHLGDFPGLPEVLGAGIASGFAPPGAPAPPPGMGYAWVTSAWVEGLPLSSSWSAMPDADRQASLYMVLVVLSTLHARRVLFGDVKPDNVVWNGVSAQLIDLDTLREVAAPDAPTITRDLTPRYAAPEQHQDRLSFLASDVWAWAVMAGHLLGGMEPDAAGFPGPLRGPWGPAIASCLQRDADARPSALQVLARLDAGAHEGGGDHTIRVPEPTHSAPPAATHRAPSTMAIDPPRASGSTAPWPAARPTPAPPVVHAPLQATPPHAAPPPAAPGPSWGSWLWTAGIAVVGLGVAAFALDSWQKRNACDTSRDEAEQLFAELRRFKTDKAINDQAQVLDRIVDRASKARDVCQDPLAQEVYALASVWDDGWHLKNARWNEAKFEEGRVAVEAVPEARRGGIGRLAETFLAMGACRFAPEAELRAAWCERVEPATDAAISQLAGHGWAQVEARWAAMMAATAESERRRAARDVAGASARLQRALAHCDAGRTVVGDAAVNGEYFALDCAQVSGKVRDYPRYISWARWLAERETGKPSAKRLQPIYEAAASECAGVRVDEALHPVPKGAKERGPIGYDRGGWGDFCVWYALSAIGCHQAAEDLRPQECRAPFSFFEIDVPTQCVAVEASNVPWDDARAALEAAGAGKCPLR
jgi:hypothetical protein